MIRIARIALLTLTLNGCASTLSGVGGTQNYACKAPVGALCTSVSGVYANALHGMAEVPRPPQATAAPTMLGDNSHDPKVAAPIVDATRGAASSSHSSILPASQSASAPTLDAAAQADSTVAASEPALRSEPRVLRLWIAPWEDSDGDLHDASVVHVVVDTGRWLIERVRPVPRSRLDGVTPPAAIATPAQTSANESAPIEPAQFSEDGAMTGPDDLSVEP